MNPGVNVDFLLFADMGFFVWIADGKEAGELIAFRSIDKPFHMLRLFPDGNPEVQANPSAVAARRMFSTAAQAAAK